MTHVLALLFSGALAPAPRARVDAIVRTVMAAERIPGLSLGLARNGKTLELRGFGMRDRRSGQSANGFTVYAIGSLSKAYTAALVLQESERGAFALDDLLARVLPIVPDERNVTIREALAQTSGFPDYGDGADARRIAHTADPHALWNLAARRPPLFSPGEGWAYSNTNYLVLGMLLEHVTNVPYPRLLSERILAPLGLHSTSYGPPYNAENLARGTNDNGTELRDIPTTPVTTALAYSAGALWSNAPDMLTWLEALRNGHVVRSESFARMTTSQRLVDGTRTGYGFGFFTRDWYGRRIAEHTGSVDGFSSGDAIGLDDGLEIVVLANRDHVDLAPLMQSIVAILDPPHDANLVADTLRPPENEDAHVTALVASTLEELKRGTIGRERLTPRFSNALTGAMLHRWQRVLAPLGKPTLVEFIERVRTNRRDTERYRLSFGVEQWWMTLTFDHLGKIDQLALFPDTSE